MKLTGVAENAVIYTYQENEVPVYCYNKRIANILSLKGYSPIYIENTDCVLPMKHLVYENSDKVSLGLRCTVDCKISILEDGEIITKEVSELKIGDIVYCAPTLYDNNLFKLRSIMDTKQDDMVYTFEAGENAVVVNGLILSI